MLSQKILKLHEIAKGALGRISIDIGKEFDCIAQLLPANPSLVEFFRRRRLGQAFSLFHQLAMPVENEVRRGETNRDLCRREAGTDSALQRLRRAIDESLGAARAENLQHLHSRTGTLCFDALDQRIQRASIPRVDRCAPFAKLRQLNIEIADVAGGAHPGAKRIGERGDAAREKDFEHPHRRAHAAQRDTKVVQRLRIAAQARGRLILPRLKEVPAQHTHTCFSDGKRAIDGDRANVEQRLGRNGRRTKEIDLARRCRWHHRAGVSHRLEERVEVEVAGLENVGLDCMKGNRLGIRSKKAPILERQGSDRDPSVHEEKRSLFPARFQDRLKRMVSQNGTQAFPVGGREGPEILGPGLGDGRRLEAWVTLLRKGDGEKLRIPISGLGRKQEPSPPQAGIPAVPKGFDGFGSGLFPELERQPSGMLVQPAPEKVSVGDPVASIHHDPKISPAGLGYTLPAR